MSFPVGFLVFSSREIRKVYRENYQENSISTGKRCTGVWWVEGDSVWSALHLQFCNPHTSVWPRIQYYFCLCDYYPNNCWCELSVPEHTQKELFCFYREIKDLMRVSLCQLESDVIIVRMMDFSLQKNYFYRLIPPPPPEFLSIISHNEVAVSLSWNKSAHGGFSWISRLTFEMSCSHSVPK